MSGDYDDVGIPAQYWVGENYVSMSMSACTRHLHAFKTYCRYTYNAAATPVPMYVSSGRIHYRLPRIPAETGMTRARDGGSNDADGAVFPDSRDPTSVHTSLVSNDEAVTTSALYTTPNGKSIVINGSPELQPRATRNTSKSGEQCLERQLVPARMTGDSEQHFLAGKERIVALVAAVPCLIRPGTLIEALGVHTETIRIADSTAVKCQAELLASDDDSVP